ncbi:hemolytic lectin LSLb [Desarmillaria tabescens]|uniref:Hemolytic lectin LSLb n=1 Tax=Armillaria tabescens TaxID=1929756 RepID=A0AA39JYK5_ARMTA|nr:hemolytic lectin LSLb [Desarmillaria tabescens]KAK0451214.1 hemolytic lectin LSLb [Desarmillaria tabescens]
MYIPPQGIYFRLVGHASQHVLFSRNHADPEFWHYKGPEYEDQLFTLIYGTGSRAGLYAIKSKRTGKVLFSRTSQEPFVGHIDGNGAYSDNWFNLEEGSGTYAKLFRLLYPATGVVIFSRTTLDPQVGNCTKANIYSDQYFSFAFEDMVVKSVEYDVALGKILNVISHVLADHTLRNNSYHEQEVAFDFSENITHTSTFEYTTGFAITAGTEFSAGIPFVSEGKISIGASQSNEWKFGTQNTFTRTYAAHFPGVKAGPHQTVHAVSAVQQGTLEVPYTIHLASKSAGVEVVTKGLWHGVSSWGLHHDIT